MMLRGNRGAELVFGHAFSNSFKGILERFQGDFVGEAHQLDLVRRFDSPAPRRHGVSTCYTSSRSSLSDPVGKRELNALFNSNSSRSDSTVFKNPCYKLVGTLVFFPGANVAAQLYLFERPALLESWSDVPGLTFDWEDHRKQAFAQPPVNAGKVMKARTSGQEDRV